MMVENLLKMIHILEGLQQGEHLRMLNMYWTCMGCNQQRSVTDSARTRSWPGDTRNYCVSFWHRILAWSLSWQNPFCGFCYQSRRNIVLSAAVANDAGRTVWGPKLSILQETEVSLSCVQCFLYLVSFSINISIFHITWLSTFWTDLVCIFEVCPKKVQPLLI